MIQVSYLQLSLSVFAFLFFTQDIKAQSDTLSYSNIIGGSVSFFADENVVAPIITTTIPVTLGTSSNDRKGYSVNFNPYYGYKINRHWIVGLSLSMSKRKSEYSNFNTIRLDVLGNPTITESKTESSANNLGAYIFGRYFVNPQNKLKFYLQPQIGLSKYKTDYKNLSLQQDIDLLTSSSETKTTSYNAAVVFGINYALNHRWRINCTLGYISYSRGKNTTIEFLEVNIN